MNTNIINSSTLIQMIQMGATNLSNYKEIINKLNVFPVPDGDTGTNMNLSMSSGVKEINNIANEEMSTVVNAFVKGLLMGARGNSGVILSQLFRGFSSSLEGKNEINAIDLATALDAGVQVAYQSVTTPVEGTILTVAKDAAKVAVEEAQKVKNITELMEKVVEAAKKSLERTPDLLPILKEVGVVDSGGKGLVVIYDGFLAALKGEEISGKDETNMEMRIQQEHEHAVQSFISAESIEYGYCTEFFVEFDPEKLDETPFDENAFRTTLSEYGDSLLVASDHDFVKIHIHTEYPGKVMTIAQQYGQLTKIDIENMRKQYASIIDESLEGKGQEVEKEYGIIAVAFGSGLKEMFESIGATTIIEGGQTMNPSTEDLLTAIEKTNAKHTFIFPNNKNIILSANQAKELSTKNIIIIPTKTIPQGISALFAFDEEESVDTNEGNMMAAIEDVKTGLVTYATRDTVIHHMEIKKDSYMGLNDGTIKVTNPDKLETVQLLINEIIDEDDEIITIFYGEDVQEDELNRLKHYVNEHVEDVDVEFYFGNQPIYSFILMVE
ncbi:DAK2 domain-containing protein [Pseudogracilibacillus auburnensis]|uniref:DAK2 domain-containing protein n=1 Tax=Pseudogracilibacillus auburnensis TaxID=1494959 RepID=UPI001A9602D2|nr:DAK2 domain-containing protein [Pseudogracilibacillus auburnensis]MBO1005243.1 DAK2 domain-containing protein [Pseudogracilibacillus auburnensis]